MNICRIFVLSEMFQKQINEMQETRYGHDALISLKECIGHLSCGDLIPFIVLYYSIKVFFQTSSMRVSRSHFFAMFFSLCSLIQLQEVSHTGEPNRVALARAHSFSVSLSWHLYFNNISQLCFSLGAALFSSTANKKIPPGVQKDGHQQPQANII